MNGKTRRKELCEQYRQSRAEAGVYRIASSRNNKALLGSTPNPTSIRNKLEFAKSTNSLGVLDQRLRKDIRQFGIEAFSFEVLEILEPKPEMTPVEIQEDLATLEALCAKR